MGSKCNVFKPHELNERLSRGTTPQRVYKSLRLETSNRLVLPLPFELEPARDGAKSPVLQVKPVSRTYSRKLSIASGYVNCPQLPHNSSSRSTVIRNECSSAIGKVLRGLRFVDLGYVLEQFERIARHPLSCRTGYMKVISEERSGFSSSVIFHCDACHKKEILRTHQINKSKEIFPSVTTAPGIAMVPSPVANCGQPAVQSPSEQTTMLENSKQSTNVFVPCHNNQSISELPGVGEPFPVENIKVEKSESDHEDAILGIP